MGGPKQSTRTRTSDWAQQLAEAVPLILDAWEQRVRAEVSASKVQNAPALRDHLPVFLLRLAQALSPEHRNTESQVPLEASRVHGQERTLTGTYSLEQVIREYAILRDVILEVVPYDHPVPAEIRRRFHQTIDQAIGAAATGFIQQSRRDLERSEERYRLLVEGVQDYALFLLDPEGRFASWNPGAEMLTGCTEDEVLGRHFSLLFTQEDREQGQPAHELATALEQGRAPDTRWHLRKDGARFWATGETRPLRTEDGVLRGFTKVMTDQTARKLVEEERDRLLLAERQAHAETEAALQRLRRLQTVTDAALHHVDLDELLQALLEAICAALDVDTTSILLREGDDLVVRASRGLEREVEEAVRVAIGSGFSGRVAETRVPMTTDPTTDPAIRSEWLRQAGIRSLLGVPLVADGKLMGVVHVGSLQQREFSAEETRILELVALRAALAIRSAELRRRLEDADRRKDEFLLMLAHEMRTPLSAISNALFLLENLELSDERAIRQLSAAARQTRHLSRLTEDLLDVARITRGKVDLAREPVDLTTVVRNAAETSAPLLDARGQEFVCQLPDRPIWVLGDAQRLEQVATNLLNNAAKYTEPGGRVELILAVEGKPPLAVLRVRDTGRGINPILLPQIFDLFVQADPTGSQSRGGLGIGLTLVRRLVERHGGTVEVHSDGDGHGSEFTVSLPLLKPPA